MHILKKILFVFLCLVAMDCFSQIKIGIEGGYNAASFAQSGETPIADNKMSQSSLSTFAAGIMSEIPLNKRMFLQPELLYFGNGTYLDEHGTLPGYESSSHTAIQLYYLRLPVSVADKLMLSNHFYFVPGAGLYAAKGLLGTAKGNDEGSSSFAGPFAYDFNKKVDFSNRNSLSPQSTTFIQTFDFGWCVQAGLELNRFEFKATYTNSFSEIYSVGGYHYKNSVLELSLTYLFFLLK